MSLNQHIQIRFYPLFIISFFILAFPNKILAKGDGPFRVETKVIYNNSEKTKGKIEFEISFSQSDSMLKIANLRSENNCFKLNKKSALFRGIRARQNDVKNGSVRFELLPEIQQCDLIFDVQSKSTSGLQSTTKVIHLKMP